MKRTSAAEYVKELESDAVLSKQMGFITSFVNTPNLINGSKEIDDLSDADLMYKCLDSLAAARAFVSNRAPYLTDTLFALIPRFEQGFGNIAVTKHYVLILDPVVFLLEGYLEPKNPDPSMNKKMQADAQRGAALMHEMGHLIRGISRIETIIKNTSKNTQVNTNKKVLANIAFDIPINDDLISTTPPWQLTNISVFSSSYKLPPNLTGEQYYDLLQTLVPPNASRMGAGSCGSCAGNSGTTEQADLANALDVELGRTDIECELIAMNTTDKIRDAASRGNVPGGLVESLPHVPEPSIVPWQTQLRQKGKYLIGSIISGQTDYSLRRPSKRSISRGIIRPGLISHQLNIAVVEDSSGSMGVEQLMASRSETVGLMKQCGIQTVWFIDADTQVAAPPKRVNINEVMTLPVHGRGGTDFRPAFEALKKLRPRISLAIYMTDGDGIAPSTAPKEFETIWCIVPSPYGRKPAAWGTTIIMSNDKKLRDQYDE